jgi:hypothetical protein
MHVSSCIFNIVNDYCYFSISIYNDISNFMIYVELLIIIIIIIMYLFIKLKNLKWKTNDMG